MGRPRTVFASLVVHFFAFVVFGPSRIFQLPKSPNLIIAGLVLKGVVDPFMYVPIFPDIIDQTLLKYKGKFTIGPVEIGRASCRERV